MCIKLQITLNANEILSSAVRICPCGYLVQRQGHVQQLKDAMKKLRVRRDGVKELIDFFPSGDPERSVLDTWISGVARIEEEVARIEEEYAQCWRCLQESCVHCCSIYNVGTRADDTLEGVKRLLHEGNNFRVVEWSQIDAVIIQRLATSNMLGRTSEIEEVLRHLREDGVGVVGMWGVAGAGKTTLLQKLNNYLHDVHSSLGEQRDSNGLEFDLVIWCTASTQRSVEQMQESIIRRLRLRPPQAAEASLRARAIGSLLSRKSFLLLVDDMGSSLDLDAVGIPSLHGNTNGYRRKLVFTTHSSELCAARNCDKTIEIPRLMPEDARRLFTQHVGRDVFNSQDARIRLYAGEALDWCGGIPFAIEAMGKVVSQHATNHVTLKDTVNMLKRSKFSGIDGMEKSIGRLSDLIIKQRLPDDAMRKCFLCCSLWPRGTSISKDHLIQCWMGLGLIDEEMFRTFYEAYGKGTQVIRILEREGLLEADEGKHVRLSHMLRHVALWEAREQGGDRNYRWLVPEDGEVIEQDLSQGCGAERVSLIGSDLVVRALPQPHKDCPNLTTLMLQGSTLRSIPQGVLRCMLELRYLDVSRTDIEELPQDIGLLRRLEYLNVSHTKINSLREEMKHLGSLKYFMLRGTSSLATIAPEIISSLSNLLVLDLYRSMFVDWDEEDDSRDQGSDPVEAGTTSLGSRVARATKLGAFRMLNALRALGISVSTQSAVTKLSGTEMSNARMRAVCITGLEGQASLHLSASFLGNSPNMKSLQKFRITDCDTLEELNMGGEMQQGAAGPRLPFLEKLHLVRLRRLQTISWIGVEPQSCLSSLSILRIHECDGLKAITWVLQLPVLTELHVSSCKALEKVIGSTDQIPQESSFPNLKCMVLTELPKLEGICSDACSIPCLEELEIEKCWALKWLPLGLNMKTLTKIRVEDEVLDQLEWRDKALEDSIRTLRTSLRVHQPVQPAEDPEASLQTAASSSRQQEEAPSSQSSRCWPFL